MVDANENEEKDFEQLAADLSTAMEADVFLYCGGVTRRGAGRLLEQIEALPSRRKNVYFFLTTMGGDPDAAYKVARYLQHFYSDGQLTLLVDWYCKSAGTLIAIAANEIVMSHLAEFGPLDVQLLVRDELDARTSGLTGFQALETLNELVFGALEYHLLELHRNTDGQISTKTALDTSAKLVGHLFGTVYAQIDPTRLGEHTRAMQVAKEYGKKLGQKSQNLKKDALDKLISGYPSHSFVLDKEDVASLFEKVRDPTVNESALLKSLHRFVESQVTQRAGVPFVLYLSPVLRPNSQEEETNETQPSAGAASTTAQPGGGKAGSGTDAEHQEVSKIEPSVSPAAGPGRAAETPIGGTATP